MQAVCCIKIIVCKHIYDNSWVKMEWTLGSLQLISPLLDRLCLVSALDAISRYIIYPSLFKCFLSACFRISHRIPQPAQWDQCFWSHPAPHLTMAPLLPPCESPGAPKRRQEWINDNHCLFKHPSLSTKQLNCLSLFVTLSLLVWFFAHLYFAAPQDFFQTTCLCCLGHTSWLRWIFGCHNTVIFGMVKIPQTAVKLDKNSCFWYKKFWFIFLRMIETSESFSPANHVMHLFPAWEQKWQYQWHCFRLQSLEAFRSIPKPSCLQPFCSWYLPWSAALL